MSDTLTLAGAIRILPDQSQSEAVLSGDFEVLVGLSKTLTLSRKESLTLIVPEDETPDAQTVSMSLIGQANFLCVRSDGPILVGLNGNVTIVNPLLILFTETTAITSLTITGTGPSATVHIVMGRA